MNYSEIKRCDIANGPGVRTSLFVSGCRHRCPFCFNEVAWPFEAGEELTDEVVGDVVESLRPDFVRGLTLLGGEPLEPENQEGALRVVERVRAEVPGSDVWLFTGFTWEELRDPACRAHTEALERLLPLLDVVVDGPFVQDLKDITLRFRGSSNQRLIDVPATLEAGEVTWWADEEVYSTHTM